MALLDYQVPVAQRLAGILSQCPVALDCSDTGTGKTYVACETLRQLCRRALVIAPKVALTSWRRVAESMGVADQLLDVVNIEGLRTGRRQWFSRTKFWQLPKDSMILWDEVHRGCSGAKTQATEMLARCKSAAVPVLAISATIAESPLKLRGLGYLCGLHDFNPGSFYAWCRAHGCVESRWHRGLEFPKGQLGRAHMLKIHEALSDRMVRMRIDDVPEFPEGVLECNLYDLEERDRLEVQSAWAELEAEWKTQAGRVGNPLTRSLRARQLAEFAKVPVFKELIEDLLEEGKAVVVFVNFLPVLEALQREFAALNPAIIRGNQDDRQEYIDRFQANQTPLCLCMVQAGGLSISLHDVHGVRPRVSLISPSWSAVEMTQCLGRIRRQGGSRALQIFVLAAGTVEEKVHTTLKGKLGNISALNDGDLIPV